MICWLTGYTPWQLAALLKQETDVETFFREAPKPRPARKPITVVIGRVRSAEIAEPTRRAIRYLDTAVDELAMGAGDGGGFAGKRSGRGCVDDPLAGARG